MVHNHAFQKCCPDYLKNVKAGKCPKGSGKPFNESAAAEDVPPIMRKVAQEQNITLQLSQHCCWAQGFVAKLKARVLAEQLQSKGSKQVVRNRNGLQTDCLSRRT